MKKILSLLLSYVLVWSAVFSQSVRFTEVWIDGTDEYIEVSNLSDQSFSGPLVISGAKSSLLDLGTISLSPWSSMIIGDNFSQLALPFVGTILGGFSLNLLDTAPLNISLRSDSILLDSTSFSDIQVQSLDNQKTAFHITMSSDLSWSRAGVSPQFVSGVISPYLGNPGYVYNSDGGVISPHFSTGNVLTGEDSSETTGFVIYCDTVVGDRIHIDEIYRGDYYSSYIELMVDHDREGGLIISGSAISTPLLLPAQQRDAEQRYLITHGMSGFHHNDNIIILSDRQIQTGIIELSSTIGEHLGYTIVDTLGQSSYYTTGNVCPQTLIEGTSSPGFDQQFLAYLNIQTVTTTIVQTVTGSCADDTPSGSDDEGTSTGSVLGSGGYQLGDISISMVDYDPPGSDTNNERIAFLSNLTGDISFSGFSLSYDGKMHTFAHEILFASGGETVITGNFQFVNSRVVCISLYYGQTVIDTLCYDPSQNNSPFRPLQYTTDSQETGTGQDQLDYASLSFDIVSVLYDPAGDDTNSETITLQFLSGAEQVVLDNFRLRVGTTNKRIYGTIVSGQTLTLAGNFQMPNSRATCIALTYNDIVYDEYCYTISSASSSSSTSWTPSVTSYTSYGIDLVAVDYDPPGYDTNTETIQLKMTGYIGSIDLTSLRLRINGTTYRSLQGMLSPNILTTITGNFQMPNSRATCVDLMQGDNILDTLCYDPAISASGEVDKVDSDLENILSDSLSGVRIVDIVYNPDGNDTDRESLIVDVGTMNLGLWTGQWSLHFDNKYQKILVDAILTGRQIITGNFQMPNSRGICVTLWYEKLMIDEYCYDPNVPLLSGDTIGTEQFSGLRLDRILPNPQGKDIKSNELIALSRPEGSGKVLNRVVKLVVGKSSIALSGHSFSGSQLLLSSSKALTNQATCAHLYVNDRQVDILCYPQTKEGQVYYHPRLNSGSAALSLDVVQALDTDGIDLTDLRLKKSGKQICLYYNTTSIRCMASGASVTSQKNQKLLTLSNAYITEMSSLLSSKSMSYEVMNQLTQSYRSLKKLISDGTDKVDVYGYQIKTTELAKYKTIVYDRSTEDIILSTLASALLGSDGMQELYRN